MLAFSTGFNNLTYILRRLIVSVTENESRGSHSLLTSRLTLNHRILVDPLLPTADRVSKLRNQQEVQA